MASEPRAPGPAAPGHRVCTVAVLRRPVPSSVRSAYLPACLPPPLSERRVEEGWGGSVTLLHLNIIAMFGNEAELSGVDANMRFLEDYVSSVNKHFGRLESCRGVR